ncbi:MAG: HlyD family efflux transporter periplasmic adaptor subunit, partial [Phycisphaerae bacterium]|nr:HlyD family efflux transporter periplasmic adaptor subunit [Phycisphaerae bacterium]
PCALVPALQRHVAMPYDGILMAEHAVAGDRVSAGDILCEVDHRELDLRRDELMAQLAIAEHEHERAMADNTPVEAQLASANARLLQTQLAIIEHEIEQARVRSPIDGIVVTGDLRRRVGGPITQGEPLFEIAALNNWTLELAIPESASGEMAAGLSGRFASNARPEQTEAFRLTRVRPSAEIRNTANVFVAEADAGLSADWLRPGLQGTAKLTCGRRPVWWVTLHKVIDYLHMTFWL